MLASVLAAGVLVLAAATGALLLLRGRPSLRSMALLAAFGAGTLLANALLHLLPESIERLGPGTTLMWAAAGALFLAAVEASLRRGRRRWGLPAVVLLGDGFHNLLDGLLLAATFQVDLHLGLMTALAVLLHELPQELGDFGLLVHSGIAPRRALALNLLSALPVLLGVGLGLWWGQAAAAGVPLLLPVAAGNFLYIALLSGLPRLWRAHPASRGQLLLAMASGAAVLAGLALLQDAGLGPHGHGHPAAP